MILYFSGTGNTEYVAKKIAGGTQDTAVNLFNKIRDEDYSSINSDKPFVFMAPTYAWQLPLFFRNWLSKTEFTGNQDCYFVTTCGADIGNSGKYNKKLAKKIGLNYKGTAFVSMPDNFIVADTMKTSEEAKKILVSKENDIQNIISSINNGNVFDEKFTFGGNIKSGLVNSMFSKNGGKLFSKDYYTNEKCVGCGKCVNLCVTKNITLVDGKPTWGQNCGLCFACIQKCPNEAIEIKGKTEGKIRYTCPQ